MCEGIRNFIFISAADDVYPCEKFLKKLEKYCIHCHGTAFSEDGNEYGKSSMACGKAAIRCMVYDKKDRNKLLF